MGGNIFEGDTRSIRKEHIEQTVKNYLGELKKVFPKKSKIFNKLHFKYLGSVGKKDISGDIDFGIDIKDIINDDFSNEEVSKWNVDPDEFNVEFLKLKKRARTATVPELKAKALFKLITIYINNNSELIHCDEKKIGISGFFTHFPQYNENNEQLEVNVQVDWMVGDIKLLQFSYFSTSYEGNVKGLHRTQLMLSMFQNLDLSFSHMKGLIDNDTKEVITLDPEEMLEILSSGYNVNITRKCAENYFCLIDIVKNLDKKDTDSILGTYLKILNFTRTDIPEDLQDIWIERREELKLTGKFLPETSNLFSLKEVA